MQLAALIDEMERRLRVSEPVIKFITVRMDEEEKRLPRSGDPRRRKKLRAQPHPAPPAPGRRCGTSAAEAAPACCRGQRACHTASLHVPRIPGVRAVRRGTLDEGAKRKRNQVMADETSTPQRPARALPRARVWRSAPRWSPGGRWSRRRPRRTQVLPPQEGLQVLHGEDRAISYRDVRLLQGFVAERGKIVPRRLTGVCTRHQRRLTLAIKQSRNIALLPFAPASKLTQRSGEGSAPCGQIRIEDGGMPSHETESEKNGSHSERRCR